MRIPITRYGLPQALVYPVVVLALMAVLLLALPKGIVLTLVEIVLFVVFVWMLMFFRDPKRTISRDEQVLLSPADGTVTDISEVEHPDLGGKALRIGIFLSICNVHINRMPCSVRLESIIYKKGQFKNAMSSDAGRINESNELLLTRLAEPRDRLLLRQISGAVARRIVCEAQPGQEFGQGETFGMIKFGSRTELYLPARDTIQIMVKIGDKINAGLSPLVVYSP